MYLSYEFPGQLLVALIAIHHGTAYSARLHGVDTFLSHPTFRLLWEAALESMDSQWEAEKQTLHDVDGELGLSLLSEWIWQLQWYDRPSSKSVNPGIPVFDTFRRHPSLDDLMVSEQVVRVVLNLDKMALEDFAGEAISRYGYSLPLNHRTVLRLRSLVTRETGPEWDEEDKVRLVNKVHQYLAVCPIYLLSSGPLFTDDSCRDIGLDAGSFRL